MGVGGSRRWRHSSARRRSWQLPPQAAGTPERIALREVLRHEARASGAGTIPLPLPEESRASAASAASASRELGLDREQPGPRGVLLGARAHGDVGRIATAVRGLGAAPRSSTPSVWSPRTCRPAPRLKSGCGATLRRLHRAQSEAERGRRSLRRGGPADQRQVRLGHDGVRAGEALAAAGGGCGRKIAVIDTGLDVGPPNSRGGSPAPSTRRPAEETLRISSATGPRDRADHGRRRKRNWREGCGRQHQGHRRARLDNVGFTVADLIRGVEFSVERGADVLNMSLAGVGFTPSQAVALDGAFINDVLPVRLPATTVRPGTRSSSPRPRSAASAAAGDGAVGVRHQAGRRGRAVLDRERVRRPRGPGAGRFGCEFLACFSTLPARASGWEDPSTFLLRTFVHAAARYAYGEGRASPPRSPRDHGAHLEGRAAPRLGAGRHVLVR